MPNTRGGTIQDKLTAPEMFFDASNDFSDEQQNWLAWARKKADWYDPFIGEDHELISEIDRDKLEPLPIKNSWY